VEAFGARGLPEFLYSGYGPRFGCLRIVDRIGRSSGLGECAVGEALAVSGTAWLDADIELEGVCHRTVLGDALVDRFSAASPRRRRFSAGRVALNLLAYVDDSPSASGDNGSPVCTVQ
jgi:hypothetical protein